MTVFVVTLLLTQGSLPQSWYTDIFNYSRWGASFWIAVVGALSGWMLTQLQQIVDAGKEYGWRDFERRAEIVHNVRRRLVLIIIATVVITIVLFFLPLVGPKLPDLLKPYAAAIPFAAFAAFLYIIISVLSWFVIISKKQKELIRKSQQEADKKRLLERLRDSTVPQTEEKHDGIDGQIHHS